MQLSGKTGKPAKPAVVGLSGQLPVQPVGTVLPAGDVCRAVLGRVRFPGTGFWTYR